jgi:hypothetical protein
MALFFPVIHSRDVKEYDVAITDLVYNIGNVIERIEAF